MPVATGDVRPEGFELDLDSRAVTPDVLSEPELDGGETSFSRYVLGRAAGDDRLVGLPVFVMRGFRHRCVLVRRDSELTSLDELKDARIGLTGWPDSGNTWTRALLRAAGVDVKGVEWTVGPLVAGETGKDRVGPVPFPDNVSLTEESLAEGLADGRFDAIMTPFMPAEFFTPDSRFRHLLPDHRAAELAYYQETGFVPGIHLVTLKRESVERAPWLPQAVQDLFEASKWHWLARRRLLADTTPWLLADLTGTARTFGADWMPYGAGQNAAMVAAFCAELHAQGISSRRIAPEEVFPV
ncbi:4,5-dihydroxyphthalate decarboxylase [Nonomuraea rosea]|uniref:4,5-dihydroxyphthalate decarboxylase n=1 Tax=Nonomuraea rosea TaxID=638574 RepID=A0ABP6WPP6_9ACTN